MTKAITPVTQKTPITVVMYSLSVCSPTSFPVSQLETHPFPCRPDPCLHPARQTHQFHSVGPSSSPSILSHFSLGRAFREDTGLDEQGVIHGEVEQSKSDVTPHGLNVKVGRVNDVSYWDPGSHFQIQNAMSLSMAMYSSHLQGRLPTVTEVVKGSHTRSTLAACF